MENPDPDWFRFYTPDNTPGTGETGEWKDKLVNKNPGWKQVLDNVKKVPGSNLKDLY